MICLKCLIFLKNSKTRIGKAVEQKSSPEGRKIDLLGRKVLRQSDRGLIVYGPHVRQSVAMSYFPLNC